MGKNTIKNNRAQVTIFIIIALIIVVAIALVFVLWRAPTIAISPEYDPQAYISKCVKDTTNEALGILMPQGGYIEPTNFKLYKDEQLSYLCYNRNYYETCVNQEPMLIEHIEKEITDYISPRVEQCFNNLKTELEKKSYGVNLGAMEITTELQTRKVVITINRDLELTKNEETRGFSKFKTLIVSPVYDLAQIAQEIVNQEARFCNFEYNGFMVLYPDYNIKRISYDDSHLYTLIERSSEEEFKFAVRSCALPPGL